MDTSLKKHEKYMRMCFALAKKGTGKTSPNPLVGCVVLNKDGEVVSFGYHRKCGENHAERDALLKKACAGMLFPLSYHLRQYRSSGSPSILQIYSYLISRLYADKELLQRTCEVSSYL